MPICITDKQLTLYLNNHINRISLLGFHVLLGILFSYSNIFGLFYSGALLLYAVLDIRKVRNKNGIAHYYAIYFMCLEVALKVASSNITWEFGKYAVIICLLTGLSMDGLKKKGTIYLIFILLLIPSIFVTDFPSQEEARKRLMFNLSGPLTLVVSSYYFYERKVTLKDFENLFFWALLPLVTLGTLLFLTSVDVSRINFMFEALYETSGGYGPNQVSTSLGFGVLLISTAYVLKFKLTGNKFLDLSILAIFIYRGLLTFSRGGMLGAVLSFAAFYLFYNFFTKRITKKVASILGFGLLFLTGLVMWNYVNELSGGKLEMRYEGISNKQKSYSLDKLTGRRDEILLSELDVFTKNPITGIGPGMGLYYRTEEGAFSGAAHTEFSRLLGEHGIFGLGALLILFIAPLVYFFKLDGAVNKSLMICFLVLALITMLHSAMRIALPGFIYGLSFLKIRRINPLIRTSQ